MKVTLFIPEFEEMDMQNVEVEFEGTITTEMPYDTDDPDEYPFGGPEYLSEDTTWNKELYTPEQNEIIERYVGQASEMIVARELQDRKENEQWP